MPQDTNATAILLFSRTPAEEVKCKQFSSSGLKKVNLQVTQNLVRHAHKVAQQTGLPVITVSEAEQIGQTFAEKLTHALELVFARDYENVIVIGNDCLQLTSGLLLQAARQMEAGNMVLGPATDGGVYLIGVSKSNFSGVDWLNLNWQQPSLGQELKGYFSAQSLSLAILPELADADDAVSLEAILGRKYVDASIRKIIITLRSLVASFSVFFLPSPFSVRPLFLANARSLRGPPLS